MQRPASTLVPAAGIPSAYTEPISRANGDVAAMKEHFALPERIEDPQTDGAVSLGTTIMAVAFNGGVVLAADSRTSSGSYVVNRTSNKLTKLTDNIYCCRSGSAADTQALAEITHKYLISHEIDTGKPPAVITAATLFQKLCYSNKANISAGIIVAGFDATNGGSVFSIPLGGSLTKVPYALGGSGSVFIYSFMDTHYKPNMTKAQCLTLCRQAVSHAMSRDSSSGGVVRTVCLSAEGLETSTTPWTTVPYSLERDPHLQPLVQINQPMRSTSRDEGNVMDSSAAPAM